MAAGVCVSGVLTLVACGLASAEPGQPATDDAGKRSAAAAVFVSTTGVDATCRRGAAARPCATFNQAYRIALPGDVVQVAGGTYGDQALMYDASKRAPSVVFREAKGQTARIGGRLDFGLNTGNINGAPASHVVLDGIDVDGIVYVHYEGGIRGSYLTFKNMHMGKPSGQAFAGGSVLHLRFENVDVGPSCCNEDGMQIALGKLGDPQSSHVTFDRVKIHDVAGDCSELPPGLWPNCPTESSPYRGNHIDCLQMLGGDHITIRNSQFVNCRAGTWMNGIGKGARYSNILLVNNFFQGHVLSLGCGGPCESGDYAVSGYVRLYYNTVPDGTSFRDWKPGGDYRLIGNIFGDVPPGAGSCTSRGTGGHESARFTVARFNMFRRGKCNPTDSNGVPAYVNADSRVGPIDLRLRPGSPGLARGDRGFHPGADIDGKQRPRRWAPDVGASQHETAAVRMGRSIGAATLGMNRAAVEKLYGHGRRVPRRKSADGRSFVQGALYRRPGGPLSVTYDQSGTVVGLATSSPYYTTPQGVGRGSTTADLKRVSPRLTWSACRRAFRTYAAGAAVEFSHSGRPSGRVRSISIVRRQHARRCGS